MILIQNILSNKIQYLKGVGPANAAKLNKIGIVTIGQLLDHYPRRYEDRSSLKRIAELTDGMYESFQAVIIAIDEPKTRRGLKILKIVVRDISGVANLIWFNQSYIKNKYKPGMELVISGKIQRRQHIIEINKPDIELAVEYNAGSGHIIPVYPTTEELPQWRLRSLALQAVELFQNSLSSETVETLPQEIVAKYKLMARHKAIANIHFPENMGVLAEARRRLVFEELYLLQCGLAYLKNKTKYSSKGIKHAPDGA